MSHIAMETRRSSVALLLLFVVSLLLQRSTAVEKKSYIVYLGGHPQIPEDASLVAVEEQRKSAHYELMGTVLGSKEKAIDAIFYSYTKNINGFAAMMEEDEAKKIAKKPGVLSVFPNKRYKLHTTHSWAFLGLEKNEKVPSWSLWKKARFGEDTIIGSLDSGAWPEHQSFNDHGMGPIPSRWKGSCDKGFPCNRKLIGARHFSKGFKRSSPIDPKTDNPRDYQTHGTHTLSTAAGRFAANASFLNNARGTAKGGSPNARVAVYKVCWRGTKVAFCDSADILAAFEAAIHDGVDVITMSVGAPADDYFRDTTAIGSFHAVQRGISVVCSAGNGGPKPGSVQNVAPWIFTVAAGTQDRDFHNYLRLGSNKSIRGTSLSDRGLTEFKPIVRGGDVRASNAYVEEAQACSTGSLDPSKAKGKIVACTTSITERYDDLMKGKTVLDAGGAGMVLLSDQSLKAGAIFAETHVLPAVQVAYSEGLDLLSYLNSTENPTGLITLPQAEFGVKEAPEVAIFSSRGPSPLHPQILKPDITAPGVEILAAVPPGKYNSGVPGDKREISFAFQSGTSMSCPHIAGIVGLFKTLYPDWSPAAIKSALMTSAKMLNNKGAPMRDFNGLNSSNPLGYGSGHVHPEAAIYPGLVYDLSETDYLNFLCSIGYDASKLATFNKKPYSCPKKAINIKDLNYPLIAVDNLSGSVTVQRTVKNVGIPGKYHARVVSPQGVLVSVKPETFEVNKRGEEKKFEVTMTPKKEHISGVYVFGSLTWEDGNHSVRSQIAVKCS